MLNRHTKQVPHRSRRGGIEPPHRARLWAVLPPPNVDPSDFKAGFDFLRSLIEIRVLERLEEIFEKVRRLEELNAAGSSTGRRAIRLPEVLEMLGISKSTLYDWLKITSPFHDPLMPRPFKLGTSDHSPAFWWSTEISDYLQAKSNAGRVH